MTSARKAVRVFISSTFRDMHAERDHLVTVVFPELRERIETLGLEFFDVDLRWGVPAKDANGETANSWEYCRQWIDRVEPFFVCILGQRYGWVPEPEQLKAREDRERQQMEKRSITDMEVRHAVLNIKLNRRSYFYLRATEAPLTASEYVDPPPLLGKLEQLKNEVRACGRPVRDYPCEWTGSSFAAMEAFGRVVLDDLWSGVLRDERYVSKEVWRQVLGTDPDSDARYTDESKPVPPELAEQLVTRAKPAPPTPLDAERQQMEAFALSRLRWFEGRKNELKQLTDFINSTDESSLRLATVIAVPGQGKSALLAKLSALISQPSTFLITHFVGATEGSASAHALVQRLLDELDRSGITWPAEEQDGGQEPKRDFNSLCRQLAKRLGDYAGERRIVILLDALNQLSDGHDLHWLPNGIGSSVRVIVSCVDTTLTDTPAGVGGKEVGDRHGEVVTPEQRVLHALESRQIAPLRVRLGPLAETDVRTIVVAYLQEYCKELDSEHVEAICDERMLPQARNPLYLLVMLSELRTLGGNDMNRILGERIASMSQDHPDTVSLFRWVLQRLEVFGTEAVRWWCLYLVHGRVGMASHELADLLSRKLGADAAATALRIERGLRRYLQRRGPQLDFFHGQLREAVLCYCLPENISSLHADLAAYMETRWRMPDVHALSELPYHQARGGLWYPLVGSLGDLAFIEAKCMQGLAYPLMEDYSDALSECPLDHAIRQKLADFQSFYAANVHLLADTPTLTRQQAANAADDTAPAQAAAGSLPTGPWLRWVNKCTEFSQQVRVLDGRGAEVRAITFSPVGDELISATGDGTVRLWDVRVGQPRWSFVLANGSAKELTYHPFDSVLAVAGTDAALHLLSSVFGLEHSIVRSDHYWVERCQFVEDGRSFVTVETSHGDRTGHGGKQYVYLRDTSTGSVRKLLLTRDCDKDYAAFLQVSSTLVAALADRRFRCWKASTGEELPYPPTQECELAAISLDERFVALTSCQREASESSDGPQRITIYEVSSGQASHELRAEARVAALSFLPDGARLFYATHTGHLSIVEILSGKLLAQAELGENVATSAMCVAVDHWISWQDSPLAEPFLIDVLTLQRVPLASLMGTTPNMLRFAPSGEVLAIGAADGSVSLVAGATLRAGLKAQTQPRSRRRLGWDGGRVCVIGDRTDEGLPMLVPLSDTEASSEHPYAWQIVDGNLSMNGRRFLDGRQMLNTLTGTSAGCAEIEHSVKYLLPPAGEIAVVRRGYPSQELALCEPIRGELRAVLKDADSRFQFRASPDWPGFWNPAEVHGENFLQYSLSPNGRDLACGGIVTVVLLDLLTAEPHWMFRIEQPNMRGVEFSPDGSELLIIRDTVLQMHASADGRRIWQRAAKAYAPQVRPHRAIGRIVPAFLDEKPPYKRWEAATFSPDGRLVAAIAEAGMVAVLFCESGELCWATEHVASPKRARFAPSGEFLLLLWDHRLEIRSAQNGAIVARLSDRSRIDDAAWMPTGTGLAIRSSLGRAVETLLFYALENVGVGARVLAGYLWEFTTVSNGHWSQTPLVCCAVCGHHQAAPELSGDAPKISCVACGTTWSVIQRLETPFTANFIASGKGQPTSSQQRELTKSRNAPGASLQQELQVAAQRKRAWVRVAFSFSLFTLLSVLGVMGPVAWNWPWLLGIPLSLIGLGFWVLFALLYYGVVAILPCPRCGSQSVRAFASWHCPKCGSFEGPES